MKSILLVYFILFSSTVYAQDWGFGRAPTKTIKKGKFQKLSDNLDASNYNIFEQNIFEIERLGSEAVPFLMKILNDSSENQKKHINAVYALGRLGKNAITAIPTLQRYLYRKGEIRTVSVIALGKIGHQARVAIPQIARLLHDKNKWVRDAAETALKRMGGAEAKQHLLEYKLYKVK